MTIQQINIGTAPNNGTGEPLRDGGAKINANFAELDTRTTAAQTAANTAQAAANASIKTATKGQPNGVASLDSGGLVPASQLPSYVDDVLEYATYADLPATGETGKIYITDTPYTSGGVTSSQFRWSGSAYVPIIASPGSTDSVVEGSANLYFTFDRVRAAVLTGLSLASSSVVAATDSVLSAIGKLQAQVTLRAPLASPTLTGDPKAPTAAVGDNDTSIATTSFVQTAMAVFGLGSVTANNVTDANAITVGGFYSLATVANNGVNGPPQIAAVGWTILNLSTSSTAKVQIASPQTSVAANKQRLFHRQFYGTVWSDWFEFAAGGANSDITSLSALTTALSVPQGGTGVTTMAALLTALQTAGAYGKTNLVGTVSQAGGIPTGAAMEYGSNANGVYIKWADGTMVCSRRVTWTGPINTALAGVYYNPTKQVAQSFAATFAATPIQSITVSCDSDTTAWVSGRSVGSATSWGTCYLLEAFGRASQTYYLEYFAIGRWY